MLVPSENLLQRGEGSPTKTSNGYPTLTNKVDEC